MKVLGAIGICLFGVFSSPWIYGQVVEVGGRVTVATSPLRNAQVTLSGKTYRLAARTDSDGRYSFQLPGNCPCTLTVEAPGLHTATRTVPVLRTGEARSVDVMLELSGVQDSIDVSAKMWDAGNGGVAISQTVSRQDLSELPTVTRSTAKSALLDPHVRQAIGLGADYQDSNRLSINAASYRNTAYVLDGTTTYDWIYSVTPTEVVSMGATQEMKVLTGNYSAQYGVSTSGILAITTRAGGPQYHGEAFAYIRPSGIQASAPLAAFHIPNEREDWGALVGGPLGGDRTTFFASYEGAQQTRGAYIQSPLPGFFNGKVKEYYPLLRFDRQLTSTQSLMVRFNGNHYESNNVNDRISGFNQPSTGRYARTQSWGGQVAEQAVFHNKVNQARFSFVNYFPDTAIPLQSSVSVVRPNYSTEGYSTANWVHAQSYTAGDLVSIHQRRNDWKIGMELSYLRAKDYSYTPFGTYTFASGAPQPNEHPLSYSQTFGTAFLQYKQTELNAFVEDNVKLNSRLSASLGLRYEFQTLTDNDANFAPRLGLAWDIRGNGKTILRGAYGLFYDQYYLYISRRFLTLGPNAPTATYSLNYGAAGFPTFPNSLIAPPNGVSGGKRDLYLRPARLANPYASQVSAALEQNLGHGLTLEISGLYVHTLKQMRVNDINHPVPFIRTASGQYRGGTLAGAAAAADATRPYQTYARLPVRDIAVIENTASSAYSALDVGITQQAGTRLRLAAHYVLSNSVSYAMFYSDANSGVPNEWNNLASAERGPGDFYQRDRFVANAWAQLPARFQLVSVVTLASGLPVNPITGDDNNGDSYAVDRPVGYARNSFRTPLQANVDAAFSRRFSLERHLQIEARVEADNLFNRHNFITVNNVFGEGATPLASFLTPKSGITNADPARQFQLAARLIF
ncbi:TonB-dependent receptor [Terriglobus albidus]|uniref:TonB-dependent receptor n=1 Tax=Terriglobus albidus TaxID=1592106 RepID=A0A5B9EDJ8_9BACT|nr:TonB-dependent receptor [Terriglobus albidus]QEE28471.1 TonB-dependent receptor [Terriglobus albidus]